MIEPEWIFKTVDEDCVNQVAETFKLPLTIARVMSIRGINSRIDSPNTHDSGNRQRQVKGFSYLIDTVFINCFKFPFGFNHKKYEVGS